MEEQTQGRMTFFQHLEELRQRLIRMVIAISVGFGVCLFFYEPLFRLMADPIRNVLPKGTSLVYTGLPDAFFVSLKIAFIAGVFLALPYIIYELWRFVHPGLFPRERRLAAPFIISATVLFYAGAAFAYFIVFRAAFTFFIDYMPPDLLTPMIDIRQYVTLVTLLMLAFGAVFETPIVIVFLGLLGVVSTTMLRKGRRYFIVLAFIIAAILSPTPDVINQTLMAIPLLLFYEVGILLLIFFERRREKYREDVEQEVTAESPDSTGREG